MVTDDIGACEVYRTVYPFKALDAAGHKVDVLRASQFWKLLQDNKYPWKNADIITFQRLILGKDEKQANFSEPALMTREAGVCVVVDYDDDYTNAHRIVHTGTMPDLHDFSGVTVSTPHLKEVMIPYSSRVDVLNNAVNFDILAPFKRVEYLDGKTVIGLTGSATHREDWKIVIEPLLAVTKEHPDVVVFISGYFPEELVGVPGFIGLKDIDPTIKAETNNFFVPIHEYGAILAQIDILLCPVDPSDKFNWSKSGLKAMEGQASRRDINGANGGCAVIATGDLPIYRDVIRHGSTGFLTNHNSQKEWYDYIKVLVNSIQLRNNFQVAGYNSARKLFDVSSKRSIDRRVSVYENIIAGDRKARAARKYR